MKVARLLGFAALLAWPAQPFAVGQVGAGRTLLATVVDVRGRTQVDLGLDDFVVTEGGQDREVLDVHVADYPVAVLIDDTTDASTNVTIRDAVNRFITRVGERPVAVGLLSDPTRLVTTLDDDRAGLSARLDGITVNPSAPIRTMPVVANAAAILRATESPFSAIVIVTARGVDATQSVEGELLPGILESGATVHVVEGRFSSPGRPEANQTPDLLRVLSDQTHGQYTAIFSPASYSIALDRLADRLSSEMMVSYLVPPDGSTGDVRVGVRRAGSQVQGLGVSK